MRERSALDRAEAFCAEFGLRVPVLMAPMAGACPTALATAVADAGGMGGCGCITMAPEEINEWARGVRAASNGAFQMNLWIPDPATARDPGNEAQLRGFLAGWGPEVPEDAADGPGHDFDAQCAAILAAGPAVVSSIMGVYPEAMVAEMKARGIKWLATVTTVTEARQAAEAGADALVAQGFEAGGHRGAFVASEAGTTPVGLFSLLPAVVDAVDLPVVATGGIADARGVAAAFMLGASAVQIGTALLRTPEAGIPTAWAEALGRARPEDAVTTRAFTGRLGRALRSAYTDAAEATEPAQFPVQGALTTPMRAEAIAADDVTRMSAWAGQSAGLAAADPATEVVTRLWAEAKSRLA